MCYLLHPFYSSDFLLPEMLSAPGSIPTAGKKVGGDAALNETGTVSVLEIMSLPAGNESIAPEFRQSVVECESPPIARYLQWLKSPSDRPTPPVHDMAAGCAQADVMGRSTPTAATATVFILNPDER